MSTMSKPPKDHFSKTFPRVSPSLFYYFPPPPPTTSYFPSTLLHLHQLFPVKWCMTALPAKQAPLQGHFSRDPQPRLPTRPPHEAFPLVQFLSPWNGLEASPLFKRKRLGDETRVPFGFPPPPPHSPRPASCWVRSGPAAPRRGGSAAHRARSETAPAPRSPGSCGTCWPSSGFCTPTKPNSRLTRRGLWGAYLGDPGPVPAVAGNVAAPADLGPTGPFPSQLAGDVNQPQASPLSTAHSFFFDVYLHTGWFCFSVLNPEVHGGHLS